MIRIELSGAPQGKGRGRAFVHKNTGRVTVMTPKSTRSYESALRYAAQESMGNRSPTESPVAVLVEARFPIAASWPKKKKADALSGAIRPCTTPDADNLLKTLDALNEVVWRDDKQVVDARVVKRYSDRPGITIEVTEIRVVANDEFKGILLL